MWLSGIPLTDAQQKYASCQNRNRFQRNEVPGDVPTLYHLRNTAISQARGDLNLLFDSLSLIKAVDVELLT